MTRLRPTRRDVLRLGCGALGLSLPSYFGLTQLAQGSQAARHGRARSCIVLYCWGGMSHHETWVLTCLFVLPCVSPGQEKGTTLSQDFDKIRAGSWVHERVEGKVTFRVTLQFGSTKFGPDAYKDIGVTGSAQAIVGQDADGELILWSGALREDKGKRFFDIPNVGKVFYSFEKKNLRLAPQADVAALKSLHGEYTLKKDK